MLHIAHVDNGIFDLVFEQDLSVAHAAESAGHVALFTDAEVTVADTFDRRGWWDDITVGSALWWLRLQPLGQSVRASVLEEIKKSLEGHGFSDVVVTDVSGTGNVSTVAVEVSATHNGVKSLFKVVL